MKNKQWFLVAAAVIILSGTLYMNSISAESPKEVIQDQLVKEGVTVSKFSIQERDLKLETKSASTSGKATIEDIKTIRKIRNEVRSNSNGNLQINNVYLTITGKNKKKIYNSVSNDVTHIPDFSSNIVGKLDSESVSNTIVSKLKTSGVLVESTEVTDNELGGKFASLVITAEISEVNSLIPKIESWIITLNDSNDTGVSQYELTINDKNNHSTLLYLTTDLVYRDFFWWQSPSLGEEVWTETKPESQESAAS